jgi:hypothetical protein
MKIGQRSHFLTFLTLGIVLILSSGCTQEIEDCDDRPRWKNLPIKVGAGPNLNDSDLLEATKQSVEAWNSTTRTYYDGVEVFRWVDGEFKENNPQGVNPIFLTDTPPPSGWEISTLGKTQKTYQCENYIRASIYLDQADLDPNLCGDDCRDYYYVAIHELGHMIGLKHNDKKTDNRRNIMFQNYLETLFGGISHGGGQTRQEEVNENTPPYEIAEFYRLEELLEFLDPLILY